MAKKGSRVKGNTGNPKKVKGVKTGGMLAGNFVLNTGFELVTGAPLGSALMRGAGFTAWEMVSPWTLGAFVGAQVGGAVLGSIDNAAKNTAKDIEKGRYSPNELFMSNAGFNPTNQYVATMRQASVQAIQGSKLNARNALGNEASLQHRAYR